MVAELLATATTSGSRGTNAVAASQNSRVRHVQRLGKGDEDCSQHGHRSSLSAWLHKFGGLCLVVLTSSCARVLEFCWWCLPRPWRSSILAGIGRQGLNARGRANQTRHTLNISTTTVALMQDVSCNSAPTLQGTGWACTLQEERVPQQGAAGQTTPATVYLALLIFACVPVATPPDRERHGISVNSANSAKHTHTDTHSPTPNHTHTTLSPRKRPPRADLGGCSKYHRTVAEKTEVLRRVMCTAVGKIPLFVYSLPLFHTNNKYLFELIAEFDVPESEAYLDVSRLFCDFHNFL